MGIPVEEIVGERFFGEGGSIYTMCIELIHLIYDMCLSTKSGWAQNIGSFMYH